jgi:hypothetical protein
VSVDLDQTAQGPPPTDAAGGSPRTVTIRGTAYPLILPTWSDPRLHLAAVIVTLQVLGQTVLDFELSIAQILVAVVTCGVIEFGYTFWTAAVVAWPASALLTGNGVAFILRVNGTEHGDWWSMNGAWIFAATAAISLVSKYVIRVDGRPLFNPSNFGLVLCFLIVGTGTVNPLDLWWGPMSPALAVALVVILCGGLLICRRLSLLGLSVSFWLAFTAAIGIISLFGHCMTARWHVGPVCGADFWRVLVTSPEILVFLFFMITDPKTAPRGQRARVAFGVAVALVAAVMIAPQTSEFATKVAVLGALVVVCAFRPLFERWLPQRDSERWLSPRAVGWASVTAVVLVPLLFVAGIPARDGEASEVDAASIEGRREVDVGELPEVEIDPGVELISGALTQGQAEAIVRDAVEGLVIERAAASSGDADLGATAVAGLRLDALNAQIAARDSTNPVDAGEVTIEVDELALVLVRDSVNPQASPQVGVHVVGSIAGGGADEELDATLVVIDGGGTWLIVDQVEPG